MFPAGDHLMFRFCQRLLADLSPARRLEHVEGRSAAEMFLDDLGKRLAGCKTARSRSAISFR